MLLAQPEMAQRVHQALSNLRELNLAGLRDLADLSFNRLSSCAPGLERLSLAYCHLTFEVGPARGSIGPQDSSPSQLSFCNLLRFLKERAGRLYALDLSGTGLPPEALQALGQVAGLRLQELSLHSCRDLSTEAVAALCRLQPGLTSLDLSGCSELADGALLAVSRGLRHLQRLRLRKLQRLTDAGCTALGGLHELQSLDMAECCLVSGRELAQALGSVRGAPPPLASLSLAYCSSLKQTSLEPHILSPSQHSSLLPSALSSAPLATTAPAGWQPSARHDPTVAHQSHRERSDCVSWAGWLPPVQQAVGRGQPQPTLSAGTGGTIWADTIGISTCIFPALASLGLYPPANSS
ncbi:leucine rich repeat containing 29 [Phyllostomus discolor]|uniref:Leucine rich repeat containing 29 n=1 Tax=Phyllostomus discolor TaxID=89673 RepID=A0A833YST5_9CHIR|nr:leucine rich repeat containing 29 [Phyllostomus discolor]